MISCINKYLFAGIIGFCIIFSLHAGYPDKSVKLIVHNPTDELYQIRYSLNPKYPPEKYDGFYGEINPFDFLQTFLIRFATWSIADENGKIHPLDAIYYIAIYKKDGSFVKRFDRQEIKRRAKFICRGNYAGADNDGQYFCKNSPTVVTETFMYELVLTKADLTQ